MRENVYLCNSKNKNVETMIQKVFTVEGMKCRHCEEQVEEAVKMLPGISWAKADHDACRLTVEMEESRVSDEQIQEAVNRLGRYELTL